MFFRLITSSLISTLDSSVSSIHNLPIATTKVTTKNVPAETPNLKKTGLIGNVLRLLGTGFIATVIIALILTGWMPVVFLGLVILLPALAPFILIILGLLMGSTEPRQADVAQHLQFRQRMMDASRQG